MGLTNRPSNRGTTDKITREVYRESMNTKRKHLETLKEEIAQTEKKNKLSWISVLGAGLIAGMTVKLLNTNGIYLGFVPAVLLWFASYWIVKKIVERMAESKIGR